MESNPTLSQKLKNQRRTSAKGWPAIAIAGKESYFRAHSRSFNLLCMDFSAIAQRHPLLWSVAISVATGLAASAAYQLMAFLVQKRRLRSRFARFEGRYEEFVRQAGASPMPTGGMIVLTYKGATKFETEAFDGSGCRFWRGEIFMRPEVPVLGEGFYSHDGRDDTGIHRVLFNPEANHFNVSGANTSHPEGVKDFKTIWRRKTIGSAAVSPH